MSIERLKEIFSTAVAITSPEERHSYIERESAGDADLRAQLDAMLSAHSDLGEFLQPSVELAPEYRSTEMLGKCIGPYRILEELGEGGFGVVFKAEQTSPVRRNVALKIIKAGMDTRQVIARFEAERQALAMMEHPNIAVVLDAGETDTGRPYFVMELVEGVSITDFCAEQQLDIRERIELFIKVCQAVQHAHQKGIIHRDLKPSNIMITMVDGEPVPKVIDFGVARAIDQKLTESTLFTQHDQLIGTPAYMSPEQADLNGVDVDTRSDIYSLGGLLYEILTGSPPIDQETIRKAGLDEIRRMIRETDPPKPSTRLRSAGIRSSTSAAKARSGEAVSPGSPAPKQVPSPSKPSDESAETESNSSTQERSGVISPSPTRTKHDTCGTSPPIRTPLSSIDRELDWIVMKALEKQRSRRFETASGFAADLQRHLDNEPVEAGPPSQLYRVKKFVRRNRSAIIAVSAVAVALVIGFIRAEMESRRATAAEAAAEIEASSSAQVAQFLESMLEGVGPSVALGRDTELLRDILDQTAQRIDEELQDQAEVEAEIRSTIGRVYFELGDYEKAEEMHLRSLELRQQTLGTNDALVIESMLDLANVYDLQRRGDEAESLQRSALAATRATLGNDHLDVADALNALAVSIARQGRHAEAEPLLWEALEITRSSPEGNYSEEDVGTSVLANLSVVLMGQGKYDEADQLFRESIEREKATHGDEHPLLARTLSNFGALLQDLDKLDEAEKVLREALAINRKVLPEGHPDLLRSWGNLAGLIERRGNLAEAEAMFREAHFLRLASLGHDHPETIFWMNRLTDNLEAQGKLDEKEAVIRETLEIMRTPNEAGEWVETRALGLVLTRLAQSLVDADRFDEARPSAEEAVALLRKNPDFGNDARAHALRVLAGIELEQRDFSAAEALQQEYLEVIRDEFGAESSHPLIGAGLRDLASVLLRQEKYPEAESAAREGLTLMEAQMPDARTTFELRSILGGSLAGQKRYAEAEPLLIAGYHGLSERAKEETRSRLIEPLERLIQFYEDSGDPEGASRWQDRLVEVERLDAGQRIFETTGE